MVDDRPSRCPMPNDEKNVVDSETSIDIDDGRPIDDLDGGHLRVMGIVSETVRRAAVVHV